VDRQINSIIQQGLLDFLDKKAFAADLGERHIQYFVAFGFDGDQFNGQGGIGCAQGSLYPICLPQRQLAGPGSNPNRRCHEWPHPAQLPAEHPEQPDPAEVLTVWPPALLLTKPQGDMSLVTFLLRQALHAGLSDPKTRYSKSSPHFSQ
jgi:hypothetical protein